MPVVKDVDIRGKVEKAWEAGNTPLLQEDTTRTGSIGNENLPDWQKKVIKVLTFGGEPAKNLTFEQLRKDDEDFVKNHPYIGGAIKFGNDTALSMTTPFSLGLMAASGGSSALAKAGISSIPATAMAGINKVMNAGMFAHGGYRAATGETKPDQVGGALEALMGLWGLKNHVKPGGGGGGGENFGFSGTDEKGALAAYKYLTTAGESYTIPKGEPGEGTLRYKPVDPSSPEFPKYLAAQRALDEFTLRNRQSNTAKLVNKDGRPEIPTQDPDILAGRGAAPTPLKIASTPLARDAQAIEGQKALDLDSRVAKGESRIQEQAQKKANSDAAAEIEVRLAQEAEAAKGKKTTERELNTKLVANGQVARMTAKVHEQAVKQRRKIEVARAQADAEQAKRDTTAQKAANSDAAANVLVEADSQTQAAAAQKAEVKNLNDQAQTLGQLDKNKAKVEQQAKTQIEKNAVQESRNLNERDKFLRQVEVDRANAEAENLKRNADKVTQADAERQAITVDGLMQGKKEVSPDTLTEGVTGPGQYGGKIRGTIRYETPKPPKTPEGGDTSGGEGGGGTEPVQPTLPEGPKSDNNELFDRLGLGVKIFTSKKEATAVAESLGLKVRQRSPRSWVLDYGQDIVPKGEDAPPVVLPPETPIQRWDRGGPAPISQDGGVGPFPKGPKGPDTPTEDLSAAARAKRNGLTNKEFMRYLDLRPNKGMRHTPAETQEYIELHQRIYPKNVPEVEVSDYTGGQPEHTIEPPVPGTTPPPAGPNRPTQTPPPSTKSARFVESGQSDLGNLLDTAHGDDADNVLRSLNPDPKGVLSSIVPTDLPTGEQQPILPGIQPTQNPAAAPVAEAPFSLTPPENTQTPSTSGDLLGSAAQVPEPPSGSIEGDLSIGSESEPTVLNHPSGRKLTIEPNGKGFSAWTSRDGNWIGHTRHNTFDEALARATKDGYVQGPVEPQPAVEPPTSGLRVWQKGDRTIAPARGESPVIYPEDMTPLDQAGEELGQMRDLKKAGLATEQGRRDAGAKAQSLNKQETAANAEQMASENQQDVLNQLTEVKQQIDDPQTPEDVKSMLQAWFKETWDKLKNDQGSMTVTRDESDPSIQDIPVGLQRAGTFMNNLRRGGLLSPESVERKGSGDVGALVAAGIEHPTHIPDIFSNVIHPETYENFKSGWNAPTPGMDDVNTNPIFYSKWNPMGLAGRTMSGLTAATKGILERSRFTKDQAQDYTLTSTPKGMFTGPAYEAMNKPGYNHMVPFSRIGLNWLSRGRERSVLGLTDLKKWGTMSPEQRWSVGKKAAIGSAVTFGAAKLTPDDFIKDHPIITRMMTANPYGAPMLAGMVYNNLGGGEAIRKIIGETPGMHLVNSLDKPNLLMTVPRDYIASYTNFLRPLAEFLDPYERDTTGQSGEWQDELFNKTYANVPGLRNTLPITGLKQ